MKKIVVNDTQYKRIKNIVSVVLLFIVALFAISFFAIIYKGIEKKDYVKFSYALFAANAIICNSFFALGRSTFFIERFEQDTQRLIYFSAVMFLYAVVASFATSGWVFINTDPDFFGPNSIQKSVIGHEIILITLSVVLGISLAFSIAGVFFFLKWAGRASSSLTDEIQENSKK